MFQGAEMLLQGPGEREWKLQKHQCHWGEVCGGTAWSPAQRGNEGWNVTFLLLSRKRESHNDRDVDVLYFVAIFSLAWRRERVSNCLTMFLLNRKNKQVEKNTQKRKKVMSGFFFSCLSAVFLSRKAVTRLLSMKPGTLASSNKSGRQRTAAQKSWRTPFLYI